MQTTKGFSNRDITANIGIYNAFRLGSTIDLTLDVRGALVSDGFDSEVGNRREDGVLSASLGLAYKFKQRGWEKPSTTLITYDEAALDAIRKQVNALERDNEALRSQLANSKTETITDIEIKDRVLAALILVTFPINKSIVSNEVRVNLGFFAKVIKSGTADVVYKVTGYADKGIGTPAINECLSIDRANAIYNVLVNEFGVSANQLEVAHEGGVENMFYDAPRVSRAVIVIAE